MGWGAVEAESDQNTSDMCVKLLTKTYNVLMYRVGNPICPSGHSKLLPTQLCDFDCTGQFLCKEMLKGLQLFAYIFEKYFQLIFLFLKACLFPYLYIIVNYSKC